MGDFFAELNRNRFIALIASLVAIGGFLFGYDTGVISGALPYISKSLDADSFEQSWIVGSLLLGAMASTLLGLVPLMVYLFFPRLQGPGDQEPFSRTDRTRHSRRDRSSAPSSGQVTAA